MSEQQPQQDDGVLIDVASELTKVAQLTGEPRVIQLMEQAYSLLPPSALATLMLRYGALKDREQELEDEIENIETNILSRAG